MVTLVVDGVMEIDLVFVKGIRFCVGSSLSGPLYS
jgi:hypothetical protein